MNALPPATRAQSQPRSIGSARIVMEGRGGATRLSRLGQSGCLKLLLPRASGTGATGILANTSGGLTSGDRLSVAAEARPGADLTLTTQACERLYRAPEGHAALGVDLAVAAGARLNWLPQETIAFDGASLHRRLEADVDPAGRLLICEAVLFGRPAMGESVRDLTLRERWRIRRGGRLIHAEDQALGAPAGLSAPSLLGGAGAMATVLLVRDGAEAALPAMRHALAPAGTRAGAGAWEGRALARILADDGRALRRVLVPLLKALAPLPRIWNI